MNHNKIRSLFGLNHKIEKMEKEKPWTLCREIAANEPVPYTNTSPVGRTEYLEPDKSLPKTGLRRNPDNVWNPSNERERHAQQREDRARVWEREGVRSRSRSGRKGSDGGIGAQECKQQLYSQKRNQSTRPLLHQACLGWLHLRGLFQLSVSFCFLMHFFQGVLLRGFWHYPFLVSGAFRFILL